MKDYRLLKRFDFITNDGVERLIRPIVNKVIVYFVTVDDVFDILLNTHSELGHGGRNRMVHELNNKYANITQEVIMIFLWLCSVCQKKSSNKKKKVS